MDRPRWTSTTPRHRASRVAPPRSPLSCVAPRHRWWSSNCWPTAARRRSGRSLSRSSRRPCPTVLPPPTPRRRLAVRRSPLPPPFGACVEHVDTAEQRRRAAVADRRNLSRLRLAAIERAAEPPRRRAADSLHRTPEVGGDGLIGHVAKLPVQLPVADAEKSLPGELKVVSLHVDRPALVAENVDT